MFITYYEKNKYYIIIESYFINIRYKKYTILVVYSYHFIKNFSILRINSILNISSLYKKSMNTNKIEK